MTYKRKKYHFGDTHLKKKWRTKRRTRDMDQIDQDLQPEKVDTLLAQKVDYEKPGLAQFYCVHCAKHFIDSHAFDCHIKSKPHKRRLHALKTEPYTIEESLRAAGMGSYVPPKKRKMETLIPEAVKEGLKDVIDIKKKAKLSTDGDGDEKMK
uniref:Zinc finger protein 593 homolog n=1 Tax=Caligus rogercresseyi TaxID=217165 RepID=C1BQ26_CALRO|nr:Zinc finger protein 593 [Caligus rogercresseyi]|eukprot:TRINITY_DN5695_c0_g1_i2.p1 TRINITY_DN5695_c0_g1~~TRINITY_DN5695_c0_g1_i2.p1  ORF type:complete len:152 (-),score=56.12 TRINITY_DN5695_c0_g1_i2:57-512(-)